MKQRPTHELTETYQRSRIALYVQVATALRRRIVDGFWEPGQKISTLEELEAEFQVARVTVRQAVELLEKEGLVQRRQGKGTFVTGPVPDQRWLRLATDWETLVDSIKDNVPHMLPVDGPPPLPRLGPQDGKPAQEYAFLKSLQQRDGEPYGFARVHVAKDLFDRAPNRFCTRAALWVLSTLKGVKIARAHQSFVIGTADTEAAHHLELSLNAPTAEAHCTIVDHSGIAIYVGDIIYRGDSVKFDIDLLNPRKT